MKAKRLQSCSDVTDLKVLQADGQKVNSSIFNMKREASRRQKHFTGDSIYIIIKLKLRVLLRLQWTHWSRMRRRQLQQTSPILQDRRHFGPFDKLCCERG